MADSISLAQYVPFLRYKTVVTKSWTTTGNTDTITDAAIKDNSFIIPVCKSGVPAGLWAVTAISNGSATITSSDSESAGLVYYYIIL